MSREIDTRHHLDDGHLNLLDVRVPSVRRSGRQANDTIDRASANKKNRSGFLLEYRGRRRNCKRSKAKMEKLDFPLFFSPPKSDLPNGKNLPIDVAAVDVMEELIEPVTANRIQIIVLIHLATSMAIISYPVGSSCCSEKPFLTTQHLRTQEDHDSDIVAAG